MIARFASRVTSTISGWIHQPHKVLIVCLVVAFVSLVLEGSLYNLWNLKRHQSILQKKIQKVEQDMEKLEMQIQQTSDPEFMEIQARQRFNMVEKGDLVFVFAEN